MSYIKFLLFAVATVVSVVFCVVNREKVVVSLSPLPYSVDLPAFVLVLLCVMIGTIVGGFAVNIKLFKTRCLLKKIQHRVTALENENKALRSERGHTLPALTK